MPKRIVTPDYTSSRKSLSPRKPGRVHLPVGKLPLFYLPYSVSNAQHSRSIYAVDLSGSHQAMARILHQSLIYMRLVLLAQEQGIARQHEPVLFPDAVLRGFARADERRRAARCQTVQPAGEAQFIRKKVNLCLAGKQKVQVPGQPLGNTGNLSFQLPASRFHLIRLDLINQRQLIFQPGQDLFELAF
ncbi:MAG: hypothetical protein ACYDHX_12070 [Methanothrix sp.]